MSPTLLQTQHMSASILYSIEISSTCIHKKKHSNLIHTSVLEGLKMWQFQTAVLLSAILHVAASSFTPKYANIIYVVQREENLNENVCRTFQCISKLLSNSTKVHFNVSDFYLMASILVVQNLTNIALLGNGQTTTLHCDTPRDTGYGSSSGVQFIGVTNFRVENIRFVNCGSTCTDPTSMEGGNVFSAVIHIFHSVNCTIKNVAFSNSNGRGLIFSETRGMVSVIDSTFHDDRLNIDRDTYPGGGGVLVQFNSTDISKARYVFSNCLFLGNKAISSQWPYSEGGGMEVSFKGTSSNNHIHVNSSRFIGNLASHAGGAVHVIFDDQASHNNFTVTHTIFRDNEATGGIGGAVGVSYRFPADSFVVPFNHSGLFYNCTFTRNTAIYGGGVSIVSSMALFADFRSRDVFAMKNCTWDGNVGHYGSAVDISPERSTLSDGWMPLLPKFEDCKFANSQQYQTSLAPQQGSWKQYMTGRGAFYVTSSTVDFRGEVVFSSNGQSAVCLVGSTIEIGDGAQIMFSNNSGFDGGAIAMDGFSALRVGRNSHFVFSENTAERNGGAISFDSTDWHDLVSKWSCFIQYRETEEEHNVTFIFYNNRAPNGPSIYASSILPCNRFCKAKEHHDKIAIATENFTCMEKFGFENHLVSTSGWHFEVNQSGPLQVLPGATTVLPIQLKDELGNSIVGVGYHARVISSRFSTIVLDEARKYVYNDCLVLYGKPSDTGVVQLSALTGHKVVLLIEVELLQCPPGFVINDETKAERELPRCVCSADTIYKYMGIRQCNYKDHFAYVKHNFWAGYRREPIPENFMTGRCSSKGQCRWGNDVHYRLPNTTSIDELIERVCAPNRIGILCSKCKEGYSVHYHATQTMCYEHNLCQLGWLLYVLSEVVPLTILFVVVMVFNVNFTSGSANAFIIFTQTFRLELVTANDFIWVDPRIYEMLKVVRFIYRFFNIEIFTEDRLSFCLWKGAQSLDIAALKYVSILYSLILIVLVVLIMNVCNVYQLCQAVSSLSRVQGCVIHGLTAFLILCYSQCTKVTLQMLTPTTIRGASKIFDRQVVKEYGEMDYFSHAHLPYAIPAIISLLTIVLPPPLLLLAYPAHYKLFRLLRINETRFVRLISFEKMKPLFDSFQGCYKDDFRFFTGIYFMFRLLSEAILAVSSGPHDYFPLMSFLITVVIMLLVTCHPYQKNWHNILDTVIFLSLLMIYIGTMYTFLQQENYKEICYKKRCYALHTFQAIASLFPLAYIIVYFSGRMVWHFVKRRANKAAVTESLPARLDSDLDSDSGDEADYLEYREEPM